MERLAKIDNVKGIKDSSGGDLTLTGEYLRRTPDTFSVLVGRDTLIYAALCMGGKGSITATANVAPRLVSEIYDALLKATSSAPLSARRSWLLSASLSD